MEPMEILKVVAPVILAAVGFGILWWLQKWFPTRKELDGLGSRVTKLAKENAATKAMADDNRDRLALMEQAAEHQRQRMDDVFVQPLQAITKRLETMSDRQETHGTAIARVEEGFKGIKVTLDDLKGRLEAGR